MFAYKFTCVVIAWTLTYSQFNQVRAGEPCCNFCGEARCRVTVEKKETANSVFDVECKAVCIPPLRFPWECGPICKLGKVRYVHKLVTVDEKKTICEYNWKVIYCCPRCRGHIRRHAAQTKDRHVADTPFQAGMKIVGQAVPDDDGWVTLTNNSQRPLRFADGLIDAIP